MKEPKNTTFSPLLFFSVVPRHRQFISEILFVPSRRAKRLVSSVVVRVTRMPSVKATFQVGKRHNCVDFIIYVLGNRHYYIYVHVLMIIYNVVC